MVNSRQKKRTGIPTPQRILDEAERLIGIHGYDGMRLRDIAEPIGIRIPSIYAHYQGREAVIAGVVVRYLGSLNDQFHYDGESDPTAALVDGIRRLMREWAKHPAYVRLCLRDLEFPPGLPEANWQLVGEAFENQDVNPIGGMMQRLKRILENGTKLGEFRQLDVIAVYRHTLVAMLGVFTIPSQRLLRGDAPRAALEVAIREVEDIILRLLRPD